MRSLALPCLYATTLSILQIWLNPVPVGVTNLCKISQSILFGAAGTPHCGHLEPATSRPLNHRG